jgi:hypothetical protein
MEQRPLRLGDIVDDYCPRERRITNHAIVAIVNEEVRQTRCTTCEAEHVYKAARVPRRRKAGEAAGEPPGHLIAPRGSESAPEPVAEPLDEVTLQADTPADPVEETPVAAAADEPAVEPEAAEEVWHTHRRLIRATLPRTEGDPPPPRPIPEFTMHQRPGRPPGRGQWQGNGHGNANGHGRPDRRQGRGNQPHGHGNGQSHGHGPGRPGGRGRHRGHKRSR